MNNNKFDFSKVDIPITKLHNVQRQQKNSLETFHVKRIFLQYDPVIKDLEIPMLEHNLPRQTLSSPPNALMMLFFR